MMLPRSYKTASRDFVSKFNLWSDLCAIGLSVPLQHGFLYASSSTVASKRLFPVFSECKVNVNNDILFPANIYILKGSRYVYNSRYDSDWEHKKNTLVWRGFTSGGIQNEDNRRTMHR